MFVKVQHMDLFAGDEPTPMMDVYVNPDHLCSLEPLIELQLKFWRIRTAGHDTFIIPAAQARAIIDSKIGKPDAEPPAAGAPAFVDSHRLVHVDKMTLDSFYSKTAQSARRMWRCTTGEGYSFNIFHHVDHRNTYSLFGDYHLWMDDMTDGQTLDWSETPIPVYLQKGKDDFYNPVKVELPDHEMRPILIIESDDDE